MKFKNSHHPYAMITSLCWSLAYVLTRLALRHFSSFPLGFLRYLIASVALAGVLIRRKAAPPKKGDLLWFVMSGALGFFLYMIAFNKGCETVDASTGSVVIATVPVMTALLARFFHGERLRPYQWVAIGIEFSGVVALMWMDNALTVNRGLIYLLLAAVALSAYNLVQRRLTRSYSGLQASSYSVFAGAAMLAVFSPNAFKELAFAPPIQLVYVAALGIFSSAVAYVAWAIAFSKADKASSVSNYMFVTPLLTTILGLWMAHEVPGRATLIGGAVILAGMLVFNFGGRLLDRGYSQKA